MHIKDQLFIPGTIILDFSVFCCCSCIFLKLSTIGNIAFKAHDDFHEKVFPELVDVIKKTDKKTLDKMEVVLESIESFCDKAIKEA